MYLNGIQHGIQGGHAIDQMWLKYVTKVHYGQEPSTLDRVALESLMNFSRVDKTFIILNGGDHPALESLHDFLTSVEHPYPFRCFREPGLNNALTSVGIVIPERLYCEAATKLGRALLAGTIIKDDVATQAILEQYSDFELEFLRRKAMCGLAA